MKWSWKIGRVAGIDIRLHATFLILLGWIVLNHFIHTQSWREALNAAAFTSTIFAIIVLHELGHALAARRFGIRTRDIVLLPMGGVARLDRVPDDPRQELLIAIAGPTINVVLAALLFVVVAITWGIAGISQFNFGPQHFLVSLFWVNVMLAAFNMLPAFPMDGGRVLRAMLASRIDYVRATQIAARIGQAAGWLFGLIGLFGNPFLVFVGLFVWMGADAEANMAQAKQLLADLPISQIMRTNPAVLKQTDTLGFAAAQALHTGSSDFPVLDRDTIVGILTKDNLELGLSELGEQGRVNLAMNRNLQFFSSSDSAESVFQRLSDDSCPAVLAVENGRIIGLVNTSQILDYVRLHSAAARHDRHKHPNNPFRSRSKSWAEEHAFSLRD
jgi:Zn-dependent protease/predicted transcriptional regulator